MRTGNRVLRLILAGGTLLALAILAWQAGASPAPAKANDPTVQMAAGLAVAPVKLGAPKASAASGSRASAKDARPRNLPLDAQEYKRLKDQPSSAGPVKGVKATTDSAVATAPEAPNPLASFNAIPWTGWIPPDGAIATNGSQVLVAVNSSWAVYGTAGNVLFAPYDFETWVSSALGFPSDTAFFDPRAVWDPGTSRFFMVLAAASDATGGSWYLVLVSQANDAVGSWWGYKLDATLDGSTPTTNWLDYPSLGIDSKGIYIGGNMFSASGYFAYSKVRIIEKALLVAGQTATWYDYWGLTNNDGSAAFSIQPAVTFGSSPVEYMVNSRWNSGNSLTLWSVSWPSGSVPSLTRQAISTFSYTLPPDASQPGGATLLDTGDARLQNAVYRNGSLWTTASLSYDFGYGPVSVLGFWEISTAGASTNQAFMWGATEAHSFYPSVMPDAAGNLGVVFNRSSSGIYPEIRYTGRLYGDGLNSMQGSALLRGSGATYVRVAGTRNRWGDYSAMALDPNGSTFWMYGEWVASQNYWGTWIGAATFVNVPTPTGTPPTATATPTATPTVGAPPNDNFANAILVGVPGSASGSTIGATRETNEPQPCAGIGATVWYRIVPGSSGTLYADTFGSNYDTALALYSGSSLGSLTNLACNDDTDTLQSRITAPVVAGTTYYLQVGGYYDSYGSYQFHVGYEGGATVTVTPTRTPSATGTPPTATATATVTSGRTIVNSYIEVDAAAQGRFVVGTTGGDPGSSIDDNKILLYGFPGNIGSGYTTLRIGSGTSSDDFRLGYNGWDDFLGVPPIAGPVSDGTTITTTWLIQGVRATERLYFAQNVDTGRPDIVGIEYTIRNENSTSRSVGGRLMLDTMIGDNDGAPYYVPGVGWVTNESEWSGAAVPASWTAYETLNDVTSLRARGQLSGGDATPPDRLVLANWGATCGPTGLFDSDWDYTVTPSASLLCDSAVALYYNPVTLGPGESVVARTYYGLGAPGAAPPTNTPTATRTPTPLGPTATPTATRTPTAATATATATPGQGGARFILRQTSTGSVNTPVTLSVVLSDVNNLGGFQFTVNYSSTLLAVENITMGPFPGSTGRAVSPLGPTIDNNAGTASFGGFSLGSVPAGPSGGGIVAYIRFLPLSHGSALLHLSGLQATDILGASITPIGGLDGTLLISRCLGDLDNNGVIDIMDVQSVAGRWNTALGNPLYDPRYDLDNNNQIDILDVQMVAGRWNTSCL